jgi:hypothetical protein
MLDIVNLIAGFCLVSAPFCARIYRRSSRRVECGNRCGAIVLVALGALRLQRMGGVGEFGARPVGSNFALDPRLRRVGYAAAAHAILSAIVAIFAAVEVRLAYYRPVSIV